MEDIPSFDEVHPPAPEPVAVSTPPTSTPSEPEANNRVLKKCVDLIHANLPSILKRLINIALHSKNEKNALRAIFEIVGKVIPRAKNLEIKDDALKEYDEQTLSSMTTDELFKAIADMKEF